MKGEGESKGPKEENRKEEKAAIIRDGGTRSVFSISVFVQRFLTKYSWVQREM
jgi:hypothetical protein